MRLEDIRTIGEALELLANKDTNLATFIEWGKADPSGAKGNLGGSRRVPKENGARKLGRGGPTPERIDDILGGVMSPYHPPSWFDEIGRKKILKRLLPKLPDVTGCLFITLTIDRNQFSGPESAFEYTRDQIRRLFYKLRKGVIWEGKKLEIDVPYFIKVEFHADGWPHFHIIFLTRRYLPGKLLGKLWTFGRPNVKRIRNKTFQYLLKYVTKGGNIPDWVLNRSRIRIVQASQGFYKETKSKDIKESIADYSVSHRTCCKTIGERLEHWRKMVHVQYKDGRHQTFTLPIDYQEFLNRHALTIAQAGLYLGNETIRLQRKVLQLWKNEIQKQNVVCSYME